MGPGDGSLINQDKRVEIWHAHPVKSLLSPLTPNHLRDAREGLGKWLKR